MNPSQATTYYSANLDRFLADFDRIAGKYLKPALSVRYKDTDTDKVLDLARDRYKELILALPDIGGDNNPLTYDLTSCVPMLALYQALKSFDKDPLDSGVIFNEVFEQLYASGDMGSAEELKQKGASMFTPKSYEETKKLADFLKLKIYPENFVFSFVEGDGKNFDFGWDFSECAIIKFFKRYGAEALVPYACKLDFVESRYCKTGLKREHTLAGGGPKCDFRFKKQ